MKVLMKLHLFFFVSLALTVTTNSEQQPNFVLHQRPSSYISENQINSANGVEAYIDSTYSKKNSYSASESDAKIAGGITATPNEFPWQTYLQLFTSTTATTYITCGGSLISTRWVLTAAVCLDGIVKADVWLGAHNVAAASETNRRVYSASRFIKNPSYTGTIVANIGLVEISIAVPLTPQIQPISLPYLNEQNHAGETVQIAGWGSQTSTSSTQGLPSPTLLKTSSVVITNAECSSTYAGGVTNEMICSSGIGNRGICPGDNGGPMVYQSGGSSTVIGVASFYLNAGCNNGQPSGFTRVSSYLNWISTTTGIPVSTTTSAATTVAGTTVATTRTTNSAGKHHIKGSTALIASIFFTSFTFVFQREH